MDLEHKAIERIRTASEMSLHHYGKPLVCKHSGGKDSDVMLELFKRSGVPFEVSHGLTTVDAPQTVRHIKDTFKRLEDMGIKATIHKPKLSMWRLIEKKKMPPCRMQRYCCEQYKENVTPHRFVATGVRWAESQKRRNRQEIEPKQKKKADKLLLMNDNDRKRALLETCKVKGDMIVNPIIDWPDSEIWDFYWNECPEHNPLYSMGYNRVGCIGCPMAGKHRWKEFADFPKYEDAYIRTFGRMLEAIRAEGKPTKWKSGYDVFLWWMEDQNVEGQISLEELYGEEMMGGKNNG
nr:MAG TPA: phosphoadenosine-phosphosulfate reductase [Caudoviricetes sp.]